jgi:hypothetical protein
VAGSCGHGHDPSGYIRWEEGISGLAKRLSACDSLT